MTPTVEYTSNPRYHRRTLLEASSRSKPQSPISYIKPLRVQISQFGSETTRELENPEEVFVYSCVPEHLTETINYLSTADTNSFSLE